MSVIPHWNRLLVAAVVAVLLTAALNTAQADLVMSGSTFYAEDFEDNAVNADPVSSSGGGLVTWGSLGQGSRTRVRVGPVDPMNQALLSNADNSGKDTGRKAVFSAAMQAAVPIAGTVDFRLYLDHLVSQPSVFRVLKDANGSFGHDNTMFGLLANSGGVFSLSTNGTSFGTTTAVVLNEWIDVSIDYSLDNSANNLTVTFNSGSIDNKSDTFTRDLTGVTSNGFGLFNPGSGLDEPDAITEQLGDDNIFYIDDINWVSTVAAVPEPSSFAFFSLVAMLATGYRRKKSV